MVIGILLLAVLLVLAGIVLVRTLRFQPVEEVCPAAESISMNKEKIVADMADMIRCKTVSYRDESLIDKKGKLCLDRADLVAFAHGEYYGLSGVLGKFGFSVADKKKGKGAVIHENPTAEGQISAQQVVKQSAPQKSWKNQNDKGRNGKQYPKKGKRGKTP